MTPTTQQSTFINHLLTGVGHVALVARAGCGKTSTIIMAVQALVSARPQVEILVCAFNAAIAEELKDKIAALKLDWKQVQASTLHSLSFGLLKFVFKLTRDNVDDKKVPKLVDECNREVAREYRGQIIDLVRFAKQAGVGFFPDLPIANVQVWHDLADKFDVNGLEDTSLSEEIVDVAQQVYRTSLSKTDTVDFDDMILFPLIKNIRVKFTKDHVIVDEYQDLSRAKQALARKFLRPTTGRMSMIGDDMQAIYGFSGADSDAMANGIRDLGATVLPLSVTWRCPKVVVKRAQTIVPDIEAAPEAPEGVENFISHEDFAEICKAKTLAPGEDAILCRNTAPLIEIAYKLIRSGIPAKVEGRAIGEGLRALATRWKVKTIEALLRKLEEYQAREMQKALAKANEQKAEQVADKVATLEEICKACQAAKRYTVADVEAFISDLFQDSAESEEKKAKQPKAVILSTLHRAKGREWNRVFLWEHASRCPSPMAKQEWQKEQERHLSYVAYTRAKHTLTWVG